jgi:hypothetical protein
MSLREKILATCELTKQAVKLPKVDEAVYVTEISAASFSEVLDKRAELKKTLGDKADHRLLFVARCTVDAAGERVFSDADVDAIAKLSNSDVQTLFNAAAELNGLLSKEPEKNSETSPSDTSA